MAKQVLYAEDEFTNRKLLEIRLKQIGIECDLAQDGVKALELYKQGNYDLIILDQYMPGMNGDQVAMEIRKDNKDIPIIAITSDDTETDRLLSCGINEVFIKPLRGQNYLDTIQRYL
jgi:CheY-like chemotaxis protein